MAEKENTQNKKPESPPIAGNGKVEPMQVLTKEEMYKKNIVIPGKLWYDIFTYLNKKPREESNELCNGMEQSSKIVKPEEKNNVVDIKKDN